MGYVSNSAAVLSPPWNAPTPPPSAADPCDGSFLEWASWAKRQQQTVLLQEILSEWPAGALTTTDTGFSDIQGSAKLSEAACFGLEPMKKPEDRGPRAEKSLFYSTDSTKADSIHHRLF